ncbi:DNA-deoxyinosine glycosylase [Arenicella xantha]|uniref:G/U mismatch-specific uracil-DNA glycosylase n=1 Tax=Arenicella xantha TaxID=644221 RepID=A0A395JSD5_9GAMM|nr:DNA-deoxyinosine glycosylase [Arenicella xantha]RBP53262.1 G/U mismatch-specific uracil-DNA glycosylase [Arenicella xantha]
MPAFEPLLGPAPKYLILGSMPGQVSLSARQYYAHPRNSFWWIMSQLFSFELSDDYAQRVELLREHRVAVWDVLSECERPGSLDSNIVRATEVPNDFGSFFRAQPSISIVGFNGAASAALFKRHCGSLMQRYPNIRWIKLPSTSPAYASLGREDKLQAWQALFEPSQAEPGFI